LDDFRFGRLEAERENGKFRLVGATHFDFLSGQLPDGEQPTQIPAVKTQASFASHWLLPPF